MITFTTGNLFDAEVDAIVNTVNTVGVMGKGIALMFKERFPENFRAYAAACKADEVRVGSMFVTERHDLVDGPRWIVNFPTKRDWRHPSRPEWIAEGLRDLSTFIRDNDVRSIAVPPLGAGNGGLDWSRVRPLIEAELGGLPNVHVVVYEPTKAYMNVAKREGVETLTPARALVAELVRRYMILGLECSLLEIQKLAYLLKRSIARHRLIDPMKLTFKANRFGPYALPLQHMIDGLDGSYLHCDKRIADARPLDTVRFDDAKRSSVAAYLATEVKDYLPALDETSRLIDGFESPLGMELLATVDWLLDHDKVPPTVDGVRAGLASWFGGGQPARRKLHLFDDRLIALALTRLVASP